ncbi:tRNA (adenine(22)-N(1))-methyltransferase [Paenibacillus sp. J31TS4]|uniref:tRNA (adenine(22)-N(1))-methyltransferase n=1 Tax=Paenibacillus sp. J31TS4 TaxID=2807195 RepID=UPI001AFD3565|nr:class I SAM-dependent methyltransferase [Paenibacillus sp. J31TS4]GIP39627.1 tRNA (adenine(22)-N(1))-methyltransferase [Paenibacillus sp. J31TS4]
MVTLSNRLLAIARQVPQGARLADIGSDHALLPVYLAQTGRIASAIAGEVNPGPYQAALQQVKEAGLKGRIAVRRGDGLEVLSTGEADTITIAGMGGNLIVKILSEGAAKLAGVRCLVLQPNVGEEAVRRWLVQENWALVREEILEEDGKRYEILTAERREDAALFNAALFRQRHLHGRVFGEETLYRLGPYLLEAAAPVFRDKWAAEADKLDKIARQLAESDLPESKERRRAFEADSAFLKEVLACLPKDKPSSN